MLGYKLIGFSSPVYACQSILCYKFNLLLYAIALSGLFEVHMRGGCLNHMAELSG